MDSVLSRHRLLTLGALVVFSSLSVVGLAACGGSAKVMSTSPQPIPSSVDRAWAVGELGYIMATRDGGAHWKPQKSGTTSSLASVAFADASHGWAVGGQSTGENDTRRELVLLTRDGGAHWAKRTLGQPGGFLCAVACTDASHIWVGGENGSGKMGAVIFASTDGGATWVRQYTDNFPMDVVLSITFADANHGWALTIDGRVLATTDGGAHWAAQRIPGPRPRLLSQVACSDADHCWIVGAVPALLLATSDGGTTWRALPTPTALSLSSAIFCLDAPRIVLSGSGPEGEASIATSTDGGASWRINPGTAPDVMAFAGGEAGTLWAMGRHEIAASTDGGATWAIQTTTPKLGYGTSSAALLGIASPRISGSASTSP